MLKLHHFSLALIASLSLISIAFIAPDKKESVQSKIEQAPKAEALNAKSTDIVSEVPLSLIQAAQNDLSGDLQYKLSLVYRDGFADVKPNPKKADIWLLLAIEKEHAAAMYDRAMAAKDTFNFIERENALMLLARSAKKNYAKAQLELGNAYYEGILVDQDYGAAQYWFQKAADQGVSDANYALGVLYSHGDGVDASPKKAMQYYQLAASENHAMAQYFLALGYYTGVGVERDYGIARELLNKSVVGGNVDALIALKTMGVT